MKYNIVKFWNWQLSALHEVQCVEGEKEIV